MKTCDNCKAIYRKNEENCSLCGGKIKKPKLTDEYLKKFLEIDNSTLKRFKKIRLDTIEEFEKNTQKKAKLMAIGISGSARDQFDMAAENSNSEFLLKSALDSLKKEGVLTELISLRKFNIKYCKACYSTTNTQCHFPCSCYPKGTATGDDMSNILYDKVLAADIILFATPVNNFKMSTLMALFIDRCISLDGSLPPADPKATKNKELNIKHTKFVELMANEKIFGSGFLRRFSGKVGGIITTGHEEGATMVIASLQMTLGHFGMVFTPWSNMYAMSSITNPTFKDKPIVTGSSYVDEAIKLAQNALMMAKVLQEKPIDWKYDNSSN